MMNETRTKAVSFLTLLTSSGTLVCCAFPALMVTLGLGATLGGLVSSFPALRWLTLHKVELFIFAAIMLTFAGVLQYRARYAPCPIDPELAKACMKTRRISRVIYFVSLAIFATGFFFAFIAAKLL